MEIFTLFFNFSYIPSSGKDINRVIKSILFYKNKISYSFIEDRYMWRTVLHKLSTIIMSEFSKIENINEKSKLMDCALILENHEQRILWDDSSKQLYNENHLLKKLMRCSVYMGI